jgi:N-acetylglucosamine kinase-like BadF-type ATPase
VTYLVGVDSGGTHTNIRILAPDGTSKGVAEVGRSLTSNRSNTELREISRDIFSAIHSRTRGDPACVWIGAAGHADSSRYRLEDVIAAEITDLNMRVGISNDAMSLLLAHDSELVVVIAGTGSVAMARNPIGEVITRGGNEWVAADYGSAFWLGLYGIRAAFHALEGGPDTAMLTSLIEHFSPLKGDNGKREDPSIVQEIVRRLAGLGTDTKPTIASFAREVTRQAELGDEEAQKIVRKGVDELAGSAARVYREMATQAEGRFVAPRFLLSGGLGYRSPFYSEAFRASLDQFLFDVRKKEVNRQIDFKLQLNGLSESVTLAGYLAEGKNIPALDGQYPFYIQSSANYRPS